MDVKGTPMASLYDPIHPLFQRPAAGRRDVYNMKMRPVLVFGAVIIVGTGAPAMAQSSMAACGAPRDSSARQLHKVFGDLRVCMLALVRGAETEYPRDWAAKASTIVLETQRPGDNRRAAIEGNRVSWTVNGRSAPLDSMAERWQRLVIDLLDVAHERDQVRASVEALRATIDSLPARRAAAASRIGVLERRDGALSRQIIALESQERLAREEIARARRRHDEVQRQATDEQNRAASADERSRAAIEANARRLAQEANRLRQRLFDLERREASDDLRKRITDLSNERASLNASETIGYLKLQIAEYDSTDVANIERQIQQITSGGRLATLEAQVEDGLNRLRSLLAIR